MHDADDRAAADAAEAEMQRDRALMAAMIRAECRAARERNPRLPLDAALREILSPDLTAGEIAPTGGLFARGRIGGRRRPEVA